MGCAYRRGDCHSRVAHHDARERQRAGALGGDPAATAEALMGVVDTDPPPLRVFFGNAPLAIAERDYAGRLATWREWQPVAELAQGSGNRLRM
jgi:hypothetical protein